MANGIDLTDAKAVLARAQRHYREYNKAIHGTGLSTLWDHRESFDGKAGEWFYSISIERNRLVAAKPILADAATNVTSALDHVIAAIAKTKGADRKGLYFPRVDAENFKNDLKNIAKRIGDDMADILATAREKQLHGTLHVSAAREIANSGKHWELPLSEGSLAAVSVPIPGAARIFNVPGEAFKDSDSFEYHRDRERLPNVGRYLVVKLEVVGLSDGLPNAPDSIFENSFRFVDAMIDAVGSSNVKAPA